MKKIPWFLVACLAGIVVGVTINCAQPMSQTPIFKAMNAEFERAGVIQGGGWIEVDCSAAAAYSALLPNWSAYYVQAVGGSPYFARATAGSGQDADSNDGTLPANGWLKIFTDGSPYYLTCDGSADSSTIRYIEVR